MAAKKGILQRLKEGIVIGDGGFLIALEKRGYVKAGPWTPEVIVEHPDVVRQLHREFLRAGSDVVQAFTFYAADDKLCLHDDNKHLETYSASDVNNAACKIAREVANEGNALMAAGFAQSGSYPSAGKTTIMKQFVSQVDTFIANKVDFLIVEYFEYIEEMEWAIEACKKSGLPIVASMSIGPQGDTSGVSVAECALRMVKAGAQVIGINCRFDPFITLDTIKIMKRALTDAKISNVHLIAQPMGFHCPDAWKWGVIELPEFPFALEPRICTRWEIHRYAREAYDLGIRYIGGCCAFEAYHIRAIAEELAPERGGKLPEASRKHGMWGEGLKLHAIECVRERGTKDYWKNLQPTCNRHYSAESCSRRNYYLRQN